MARARKPVKSSGMFRPKERLIYTYWDGQKDRAGDPLELIRKLTGIDGFSLEHDAKLAAGQTPEATKALGRLVEAVRSAFGVKNLEEGGLTETETLALLHHFLDFLREVQRDAGPLPTSRPSTGCPANGSATGNSSASGSAASAP
jgi:hypothetical protein